MLSCLSLLHTCPQAQTVTGTDCNPVFVTSHQELEGWWPFRTNRQERGLAVELTPITLVSRTTFLPLTLSYRLPPNIRAPRQKAEDASGWVRAEAQCAHPSEDLGGGVR